MNESNNYALNISTYKVTIFYPYTRNLLPEKIFTHTGSFIIRCFDSGYLIWLAEMKQLCSPKKEHSLLVLPFVNASLNFATKFFDMLTKLQFKHS